MNRQERIQNIVECNHDAKTIDELIFFAREEFPYVHEDTIRSYAEAAWRVLETQRKKK
jgi:hypothetical protein